MPLPTREGARLPRRVAMQVEVRIARKQLRRLDVQWQAGEGQFALPRMHMADAGAIGDRGTCRLRRLGAGMAPHAQDVEQRVAHQAVAAVDATGELADAMQPGDARGAVLVDRDAAVLVVQRRIHEKRSAAAS